MQAQQNTISSNETAAALAAAYPKHEQRRVLLTIKQFSECNPAFSQSALRNLVFKADERQGANGKISGNGLIEAGALIRIGRKVLIDEDRFFGWVDAQNCRG